MGGRKLKSDYGSESQTVGVKARLGESQTLEVKGVKVRRWEYKGLKSDGGSESRKARLGKVSVIEEK